MNIGRNQVVDKIILLLMNGETVIDGILQQVSKVDILRAIHQDLGIETLKADWSEGSTVTKSGLVRAHQVLDPDSVSKAQTKAEHLKYMLNSVGQISKPTDTSKGSTVTKEPLLRILLGIRLQGPKSEEE